MTDPVKILIGALGGEGGGVLSGWFIAAATSADLPVQGTSIPGVAQRTGATTYYVEIYPKTNEALGGRRPLLALYPGIGDVDVVVASELLEAARAAEAGLVTPDRTTLVAATHRLYSIYEKIVTTDGRIDAAHAVDALGRLAKRPILFDLSQSPAKRGAPLNAVLLGVVAGTGLLPIDRAHFEAAIRASGIAVDANLKGFAIGYGIGCDGVGADILPCPEDRPASQIASHGGVPALAQDLALPAETAPIVQAATARLLDYQDARYVARYEARLRRVAVLPGATPALISRTARHLALWMAYEDIVRVAQLKSRKDRVRRLRQEIGAKPEEPVIVREFFKPGVDEVSALLPPFLGRRLENWADKRDLRQRLHFPMRLRTSSVSGFLRLWLLARLRFWRPFTYRWAEEQGLIERWLNAIIEAHKIAPEFAYEVAGCPQLLKGYSDTQRRGRGDFLAIFDGIVEPALAQRCNAAAATCQACESAQAEPERHDQAANGLTWSAPELRVSTPSAARIEERAARA